MKKETVITWREPEQVKKRLSEYIEKESVLDKIEKYDKSTANSEMHKRKLNKEQTVKK